MAKEPTFLPPRRKWVVIVRVNNKTSWGVYGPMTHDEAVARRDKVKGTGMECYVALWMDKLPA